MYIQSMLNLPRFISFYYNVYKSLIKSIFNNTHTVLVVDDRHVAFCEYNGSVARISCVAVATLVNEKLLERASDNDLLLCRKSTSNKTRYRQWFDRCITGLPLLWNQREKWLLFQELTKEKWETTGRSGESTGRSQNISLIVPLFTFAGHYRGIRML